MNLQLIAFQVGDAIKYASSVNEIDRIARSHFRFECQDFPVDSITSVRAHRVYNWIMTLGKQAMMSEDRQRLLTAFCRGIAGPAQRGQVDAVLVEAGVSLALINRENLSIFNAREFHTVVHEHARRLFVQGEYFHAVFEAVKAYHQMVQSKAQTQKDGHAMMLEVWSEKGVLKVTPCETTTDCNIQNGIGFLSAGLMQAVRNPAAHETAIDWPMPRQDALDLLAFLSFLLRQVDKSTFVPRAART